MKSLFDIGINSLKSNQYAMSVTGQNIANANNTSYSRRDVVFSDPFYSVYGNGTSVAEARRLADASFNRNVQISTSALAKSDVFVQNMQNLETLFDAGTYSLSNYFNESLKALNVMNTDPASAQSRDMYLYQLKNIAARFNAADNSINKEQNSLNSSLKSDVKAINELTNRLAQLNNTIPTASKIEQDNLFDQRDELLNSLSKYCNFDSSTEDNGIVTIKLSNGIPLVLGTNSYSLTLAPATADPSQLEIILVNNKSSMNVTSLLTGGEIGGLLVYQNNAFEDTKQSLGRLALVFAQKLNNQNKLGIDLNGYLGGNIFNDNNQLKATKDRVINNTTNQGIGDMAVIINDAEQLTTSDYQLEMISASEYQLIRLSDHQIMSSGDITTYPLTINVDGFSLNIASGNFVIGDKFTISPTKNAASAFGLAIQSGAGLALGIPIVTGASLQNSGTGKLDVNGVTDTTNTAFSIPGQLNPPIIVEFLSATSYRLVSTVDNTIIEDNLAYNSLTGADVFPTPGGVDPGYRIHISGDVSAGDNFSINYNVNGAGDNRNGLLLADLYQQGVLENNSLTFNQAYHLMSNTISSKINSAQIALTTNTIIQNQAESRRDQLSGVSLQEETINLARFQQAYEASAQIIDVGKNIFDIVIGLSRR